MSEPTGKVRVTAENLDSGHLVEFELAPDESLVIYGPEVRKVRDNSVRLPGGREYRLVLLRGA